MQQSPFTCRVRALDHLVLTVVSIPDTVQFYSAVLGMRAEQFDTVVAAASDGRLNSERPRSICTKTGREFDPKAARSAPGLADLCFLTDAPLVGVDRPPDPPWHRD